ncbi:MAG: (deoxy)nucleoside triphosphate pyrophosphohydrolase [Verrucomicrobiales bacterium]|nr:(deoxy)nucleoside triphosphate pyrophosphohydrolase [Verrucomicrobiales bacterium]
MPSDSPLLVVCAVLSDAAGNILAARRGAGRALPGKWEFPGGKLEPNETPQVALRRELQEELDIRIEVGTGLTPVLHDYPDFQIHLLPFHCRIQNGQPAAREHAEIRWIAPQNLAELDWAEADLPIVKEVLRLRQSS